MFTAALFITGTTQAILPSGLNVGNPYNEIPLNNKKEQTTDMSNNIDKIQNTLC